MTVLAIAIVVAAVIIAFTLDATAKQISGPLKQQVEELKSLRSAIDSLHTSVRTIGHTIQRELDEIETERNNEKWKVRAAEREALNARIADGSARVFEG